MIADLNANLVSQMVSLWERVVLLRPVDRAIDLAQFPLGFSTGDADCKSAVLQRPMLWLSAVFLPIAAIGQMYFLESTMGSGGTNYVIPCYVRRRTRPPATFPHLPTSMHARTRADRPPAARRRRG